MKNTLISIATILLVASCATTNRTPPILFQTYSQYKESTNEKNIKKLATIYFSQSLLGENYLTNPDATSQFLFKNYMTSTVNHYEKLNSQNGCLTINGYDEEKAPLIFSLKYIFKDGHWLIDKIHVVFIENINNFSKEAKCPEAYVK